MTLLRSMLYLPASNERALAKAATLPVDAVILDLEDAVAPEAKQAARHNAVEAVRSGELAPRLVAVRVNDASTPWHEEDLAAVAACGPDAVVVPKVASGEQVRELADALTRLGAPRGTRLWAMVETPVGVLHAAEIASATSVVQALVVGTNDLVKELRARHVPGRAPVLGALGHIVLAARSAGVAVLDGVYNAIGDADGLAQECRQGRDLGFDGKTLVHPSQVEVANAVFGPAEEEVEQARQLVAAWEDARADGAGVVVVDGRMVEALHVEIAREVIARSDEIAARSRGTHTP